MMEQGGDATYELDKVRHIPRLRSVPTKFHNHKERDNLPEIKTAWGIRFREYRAYADAVVELMRKQGWNSKLILRIATDRDWLMDVRDQQ